MPAQGELRRSGRPVPIQPLLFNLLVYLVKRRGELITKEQLLRDVWGGVFTTGVITTAMGLLRQTLEDDARDPQFIKTVRGRGYRFVASVTQGPRPSPSFVGREQELETFRAAIERLEPFLFWLHGIGGIGKSALLRQFAALCDEQELPYRMVFSSHLGTTPGAVETGFRELIGGDGGPVILFIDNYDELRQLDEWLRTQLLAKLNPLGVVFASRHAPPDATLAHSHWQVLKLGGLAQDEGTLLLTQLTARDGAAQLPAPQALELTKQWEGHPLALSMIASLPNQEGRSAPPDLYRLSDRFLVDAPSDAFRKGLEAAALVPEIDVDFLHRLSGADDIMALLSWLGAIPFVRVAFGRVDMDRVARAALVARLAQEHPARLNALAAEAFELISSEALDQVDPTHRAVQGRQIFRIGEHHPLLRPLYQREQSGLRLELATSRSQRESFLSLAGELSGEETAKAFAAWLRRESELWCVLDDNGVLEGGALVLYLDADELTLPFDPLLSQIAAFRKEQQLGPGRLMVHRALYDRQGLGAAGPAMRRCMEVLHDHHQTLPKDDITESYVVFGSVEPWVQIGRQVADFQDHFVIEEEGQKVPVLFRDMSGGTREWLSALARNLSAVGMSPPE